MRSYFIIGTKWRQDDGSYTSMYHEMLHTKSVGVGYAWQRDMTKLYGRPEEGIKIVEEASA